MPDSDANDFFEGRNRRLDYDNQEPVSQRDLLMEQILENIKTTPIGQVLNKIALLPGVRKDKILDIRRRITEGNYNLNQQLDLALDRVIEQLTSTHSEEE